MKWQQRQFGVLCENRILSYWGIRKSSKHVNFQTKVMLNWGYMVNPNSAGGHIVPALLEMAISQWKKGSWSPKFLDSS